MLIVGVKSKNVVFRINIAISKLRIRGSIKIVININKFYDY